MAELCARKSEKNDSEFMGQQSHMVAVRLSFAVVYDITVYCLRNY